MEVFLTVFVIAVAFFYLAGKLLKFLLLRKIRKGTDRFFGNMQDSGSYGGETAGTGREGDVSVSGSPSGKKVISGDDGDYVDFEEIK